MASRVYTFYRDKVTVVWSVVHIIGFVLGAWLIYALYDGGLFSAWFIAMIIALLCLMVLSVPKSIVVDDRHLTIDCVMDVTQIKLNNIISVKKVSPRKIRWVLPIFGGCGFWGYYGHFFDFRSFRRVTIYATEWRYLVEIVDIYEDHIYISCRDRDALIAELSVKSMIED